MPSFLHIFKKELEAKENKIEQILTQGCAKDLEDDLCKKFRQYWYPLPSEVSDVKTLAVDSSRATRNYANGASIYIARAMALGKGGNRSKELNANAFVARGKQQKIRDFVRLKAEHLEHKVALKELGNRDYEVLLLDGSLYTRMMTLPHDLPIEEDFMLEYKETLHQLIQKCRDENIILIGVSKDSSANFFRNNLLQELFTENLDDIVTKLVEDDISTLQKLWEDLQQGDFKVFQTLHELQNKYGEILDEIYQLFEEYALTRVDFSLIHHLSETAGYTKPVELGPATPLLRQEINKMRNNPDKYIEQRFEKSLALSKDSETLKKRGKRVLNIMLMFPTITSFHLLLDKRDSPVRIDVLSSQLDEPSYQTLDSFKERSFYEKNDDWIEYIISILKGGYAGLNTYNVLLKQVDEKVKLQQQEVDNIYEKILSNHLNLTLIHTRRYRRVQPF